jgi:cytochrome c
MKCLMIFSATLALLGASAGAHALDAASAEALVRKSKCMTCHSIDKKKDGPSFRETAGKMKGKPEAMDKLTKHITVPSKVKVDGKDEDHELIRSKDPAEIRNVVEWILSL